MRELLHRLPLRIPSAAVCALVAFWLWADRPGLETSLTAHAGERTVWRWADPELRLDPELPEAALKYPWIFEVRWQGWIDIRDEGEHRLRVVSGGPTRVVVDGVEVVSLETTRDIKPAGSLGPGLHRLELELRQRGGEVLFETELKAPRRDWAVIPPHTLYSYRPSALRRAVREAFPGWSRAERNLVATVFFVVALLLLRPLAADWRRPGWLDRAIGHADAGLRAGWLAPVVYGAIVAAVAAAVFSRTGSPFGWDDVRYLDMALFNRDFPAFLNRYAHVYLLKPFLWLSGGDPFVGARLFWSVQLGLIVASLAAATRALGAGVSTFVLGVFLLFCQPLFFIRAGAAVPDTTVATLLMIAVALYLHRRARGLPSRWEWQILLIGALTVWAIKSKELGAILLGLAVLLFFEGGRLDPRAGLRKLGSWALGAVAGLALLLVLDGIFFGDPLRGFRPENLRAVSELNFAADPQKGREEEGWIEVLSQGKSPITGRDPGMRYVALLVVFAALVAAHRRRSLELELLHLLPVFFVLLLMLIHVRATYVFLARYLYPIIPVSAFLIAAGFHYLGLDELRWRDLASRRFLVASAALAFLVFGIALPYKAGRLEAHEFLPGEWLAEADWTSLDAFVRLVGAPSLVLALVIALVLLQSRRRWRMAILLTLVALFLGLPFRRTVQDLSFSRPWQRAERHLHPLRVMEDEIPDRPWALIEVSPTLLTRHRMFGVEKTYVDIIRLFLRRPDVSAILAPSLDSTQDVAFLAPEDYDYWRRAWPELAETAVEAPGGEFVLVKPATAPRSSRAGTADGDQP